MINKWNKKGALPQAIFGTNFIIAMFLVIVLFIFLGGGGASTIFNISKTISNVPTFIWIILGIILLFKFIGGKR